LELIQFKFEPFWPIFPPWFQSQLLYRQEAWEVLAGRVGVEDVVGGVDVVAAAVQAALASLSPLDTSCIFPI
jgi:hypothetical protein